jgi:hypothetical protein
MMWNLLFAAALVSNAGEFDVQTLDGQSTTGRIVALDDAQLVLETPQGRRPFAIDALAAVIHPAPPNDRKANLSIELVDGSIVVATQYLVHGSTARVTLTTGVDLDVPTRGIRWVRFSRPGDRDATLAGQWADAIGAKAAGDLLVVRKNGVLDYLEGVQGDVDADTCNFELDKEQVPVKRAKVEGIVYFHPPAAELPDAVGKLESLDGTRLAMRTVRLEETALKIATPGGLAISVPLDEITRLDFTSGKIAFLSELEPESATFVPFLGFKEEPSALRDYYRYRRNIGFDQSPLRLEIKGDGRRLWQGDVRGTEPARDLELDVAGVKRLEIVADYGDDQDIGDRLNLCDARVTK